MTAPVDLTTVDVELRWTVARIVGAVRDGAGNMRQVAIYVGSTPAARSFRVSWQEALDRNLIRYVPGCCDGAHGWGCEVEV